MNLAPHEIENEIRHLLSFENYSYFNEDRSRAFCCLVKRHKNAPNEYGYFVHEKEFCEPVVYLNNLFDHIEPKLEERKDSNFPGAAVFVLQSQTIPNFLLSNNRKQYANFEEMFIDGWTID